VFKHLVTFAVVILLISGCSQLITPSPTLATTSSGIEGYVTEGPTCPGPVPAGGSTACADKPYQATLAILDTSNNEVARIETDTAGYFKINLAPGSYTLHPLSENILPHASDQEIVVKQGEYIQVNVMYDTGMR
jgi:hypothetical protein